MGGIKLSDIRQLRKLEQQTIEADVAAGKGRLDTTALKDLLSRKWWATGKADLLPQFGPGMEQRLLIMEQTG